MQILGTDLSPVGEMIDRDDVMTASATTAVMAKTINPVTTKTINVVMTTTTTMKAVTTSDLSSVMNDKKTTKISYYFIFVFIIVLFHISNNIHVQ